MWKQRWPVAVALAAGLLAAVVAWWGLRGVQRRIESRWTAVSVVVLSEDLPAGAVLERTHLARRDVPEQFVTESVVRPDAFGLVLGQRLLVPAQRGDPLLWTHLEGAEAIDGLSQVVQRRGRAFSLPVTRLQSVGGWIRPNDHVDVLATFTDPRSQDPVAVTLLQNVLVLATGDLAGRSDPARFAASDGYDTVTVLVLPEEVEILALGLEVGNLSLSLRNPDDMDLIQDRGRTTPQTLLGGERVRTLEQRRFQEIEVIRGHRVDAGRALP